MRNIEDNESYAELEFVLLNYNSTDGMHDWVKENLAKEIATGKVVYYHTIEPVVFSHSHSKNMAFNLAQGDIVCSINADHFTGRDFANYVNEQFNKNPNSVLTTVDYYNTMENYNPSKDVFGRVCANKADFLKVGGFDEMMENYGFEDWDFVNRLEMNGTTRVLIEDFSYLNFISHSEQERYTVEDLEKIYRIYIGYLTPSTSDAIILFTDKTYERGTLIDNSTVDAHEPKYAYTARNQRFEFSLVDKLWQQGTWTITQSSITLQDDKSNNSMLVYSDMGMVQLSDASSKLDYYHISNPETVRSLITFGYFYQNRGRMERHLEEKTTTVNHGGFGLGSVSRNWL